MPDFIGLSDLEHDSAFVTREVDRRLRSDGPLSLELIPWPKPTGGHRNLAVLDPIDEIAMRVAVTPIIHRFGRSLHRNVFSGQLRTGGPGWHFASARSATRELRSHLSRQVEDPSFVSLLRTDVASFYPSLTPNVTQDLTGWFDPDSKYLHYLDRFFEEWRTEGLIGLPIGPEVSLLLANCALSPLDHLIDLLGYPFGRYTDDVSVLNLAPEDQESFIELTDEVLTKLGLMRSQPKTEFTTEPAVALEWVGTALLPPPRTSSAPISFWVNWLLPRCLKPNSKQRTQIRAASVLLSNSLRTEVSPGRPRISLNAGRSSSSIRE